LNTIIKSNKPPCLRIFNRVSAKIICCILFLLVLIMNGYGQTETRSAGTVAESGTGLSWSIQNAAELALSNDVAGGQCGSLSQDASSKYLNLTNFGFTIPGGSSISGIEVTMRSRSTGGEFSKNRQLYLLKSGSITGANKLGIWPTSYTTNTYGNATDLWSATWTSSDINNFNFGVTIKAEADQGGTFAYLDFVSITIHYLATLPIQLISFTAKPDNGKVLLDWQTASETNNDYFTIEKSSDAILFEEVLRVNGAGNSSTQSDYTAIDHYPNSEVSYYRLKQTDFDGQHTYSRIVMIRNDTKNRLQLFPNPANAGTSIYLSILNTEEEEEIKFSLYSLLGKEQFSQIIVIQKNSPPISIKLPPELAPGIYAVVCRNKTKLFRQLMIVK
jgi:hypothetical protein